MCVCSADRQRSGLSWYCLFMQYYRDLGRYIKHYAVLKRAWEQLKSFLQQRCPRMIASLKGWQLPRCSSAQIVSCAPVFHCLCSPSRGRHRGAAEHHRGPDRMQTSRRLPLLVPHPQWAETGHPRVCTCVTQSSCLRQCHPNSPVLVCVCVNPQADGQHVFVQPLPLRGAAGCGDGCWGLPAEEGDAALPAAHLLLPHRTQPVHGAGAHRGAPHV